jgi:ubiquinone biosynthesis protein
MMRTGQFFRLIHINYVLAKHGLGEIILATHFFAPIRFIKYFNPWYWLRDKNLTMAIRIRLSLEELGPVFVKFGQALSTRQDLLPDDLIKELEKLQDKVPPFSGAQMIVEKVYGQRIAEVFASFDMEPLASASIAQVHAATLLDGRSVVVKVRRPNVQKVIQRDIALLYTFATLVEKYWPPGRRLHAIALVREFEKTILDELDLTREAANGAQLRRNFLHSELLYIPEIYWPLTREQVMVMERIYGIPVSQIETLRAHQVNLKKLAERGIEIFFTQVFRDSFFHADMHPGNIFVSYQHPENPQYIAIDYGIIGTLSKTDQRYLAENMVAFFRRDYHRVAELHLESGWVPANTRIEEFESAIRTVCEPIFEKPLKDISFGHLLLRLFQVGKRFHMEVQPQLILLQKTLLHIEGLGRQLDPELDLWKTAKPFLENWIKEQMGVKALVKNIFRQMPFWLEKLPEIPDLLYAKLQTPTLEKTIIVETPKHEASSVSGVLTGIGIALLAVAGIFSLNKSFYESALFFATHHSGYLASAGVLALLVAFWRR